MSSLWVGFWIGLGVSQVTDVILFCVAMVYVSKRFNSMEARYGARNLPPKREQR